MKILQLVTKRQYRGAEVFAANLSKELILLGHDILFVGLYSNNDNVLTVENAHNIDLFDLKPRGFSFAIVIKLFKLINKHKPDVIQCNGSDTLKYMIATSYFVKKRPLLYRNISTISEWLGSGIKLSLYKKMFHKVDFVTSVGQGPIQDLIETLGYPKNKTAVIRRGIPTESIRNTSHGIKLREELGLQSNNEIVMHIGNFSPEKNHLFLIEIFKKLAMTNPSIKLICVGDGVTFKKVQEKIKEFKLENTVFLLGFRKEIPQLLSAADMVILTSLIEGVPGVILEAAVQEKPSVASNVGGIKEVLIDGETGFIINDFDEELFKNKIITLCESVTLRERLGANARKLVMDEFSPIKNAKKFEQLYADLAGIELDPLS